MVYINPKAYILYRMDELTILEKSKAEVTKLEGENRRWEETQNEKLDSKSEKALDFYRNERITTLKNRTDEIAEIAKKIEALESRKTVIQASIPEYIKYSDAAISRLSKSTLIRPERIRRNDDTIKDLKRKILLMEMDMNNKKIIDSPGYQYNNNNNKVIWNADGEAECLRPKTPPSDIWIPNPDQKTLDIEEEIKIARASRVREPEI